MDGRQGAAGRRGAQGEVGSARVTTGALSCPLPCQPAIAGIQQVPLGAVDSLACAGMTSRCALARSTVELPPSSRGAERRGDPESPPLPSSLDCFAYARDDEAFASR